MSTPSIIHVLDDPALLAPHFAGQSWATWRMILGCAFGLAPSPVDLPRFHEIAGDRDPPLQQVSELIVVAGRGGGKSAAPSPVAPARAVSFDPLGRLRPGEKAVVMILAVDRSQAAIVHGFIRAYFQEI